MYCLAIFEPQLTLVPPLSWMLMGRSRFVCFNFITTMVLSAPLARLPQRRNRIVVCLLIAVLTCVSIVPFLAPALNHGYLANLKTRVDPDGVCRQSNAYTCGPAAAVTGLRKLGFPAEEGEIAILAHTSSLTGTEPDVLAQVLQQRYGADGLMAEYRPFKDIEELKNAGITIAILKFNALQDHCVAIFGVQTNGVSVADPLTGLNIVTKEQFEEKWQFVGIVLKRVGNGRSTGK